MSSPERRAKHPNWAPEVTGNPAGRPNKYDSHVQPRLAEVTEWVKAGYTYYSIAEQLGVSTASFIKYQSFHPDLVEAIQKAKAEVNALVVNSLLKKAVGYREQRQMVSAKGDVVDYVHVVEGNVTAQIFWLKNQLRDEWSDRKDVIHDVGGDLAKLIEESMLPRLPESTVIDVTPVDGEDELEEGER